QQVRGNLEDVALRVAKLDVVGTGSYPVENFLSEILCLLGIGRPLAKERAQGRPHPSGQFVRKNLAGFLWQRHRRQHRGSRACCQSASANLGCRVPPRPQRSATAPEASEL